MESSSLNSVVFGIATFAYLFATFVYVAYLAFRSRPLGLAGSLLVYLGIVTQLAAMVIRGFESAQMGIFHMPLSNMYESLAFFAWCIMLAYAFIEWKYQLRAIGAFVAPLGFAALGLNALAFDKEIKPLVPALQSNWLTAHVVTSFISYGCFAVSFAVSLMYLWRRAAEKKGRSEGIPFLFPELVVLDDLNYKTIAVGFPLLTLGIITGAAWANSAWGSYWSWDPKETWSLITWFVYAAYLHARLTRGWQGTVAAAISIVGFAFVIFTYFGVNFLLSGLHSYA
jgi:cytochrome c-type biogenesis protein CcsB